MPKANSRSYSRLSGIVKRRGLDQPPAIMAFLHCEFVSETLGLSCSLNAILNQAALAKGGGAHRSPVLYLLHGLTEDHTVWCRRTSLERYAEKYDVAIVMPSVHRSCYANMEAGYRYWDFIAEELPRVCRAFFPIASEREKTFVAGLSMGGYGAFKLALSHPDRFAAAASLSGALDLWRLNDQRDELLPEWPAVFGSESSFPGSENDLMALASLYARSAGGREVALFQSCGTEDRFLPINRTFHAHCQALGVAIDYEESPGEHEWGFWDQKIQDVLEWLPIERLESEE